MSEDIDDPRVFVTCPGCRGKCERGDAGGYLVPCPECDGAGTVEACCVCGAPSVEYYDAREDCPVCAKPACGFTVQQGIDYHEEIGDR